MTISGIALDKDTNGDFLVLSTICIVSICFSISFILFVIRTFQVYKQNTSAELVAFPEKLLQACHLLAMFFSCFYMFLYVWNYVHIYSTYNVLNCSLWYILIMISITMTKVFIYSFLMLRSTLSFKNSFFELSIEISISITLISCISQLTWMALMLCDFNAFSPFMPINSLCFRTLGPIGTLGIVGFNINDAISSFVALLIFWIKAASVKTLLFYDKNSSKASKTKTKTKTIDSGALSDDLNNVFNKHIKLGMLIVLGSILIFLAGEFLTILMGVASTLHQCFNNIYIFLLFKENNKFYNIFCKCKQLRLQIKKTAASETETAAANRTIVGVLCEMKSKSLSVIPRPSLKSIGLGTRRDIKSASSSNLAKLKLIRVPTSTCTLQLSETPIVKNHILTPSTPMIPFTPKSKISGNTHQLKATLTPLNLIDFESEIMQLPELNATILPVVYD